MQAAAAEGVDGAHHAAQFRQPLEAANAGIAGVHPLADVVDDDMAMVGPHRDLPALFRLDLAQGRHNADHVGIAVEMLGLVERAVGLARGVAQMREMHAWAEALRHGHQVVLGIGAIGTGTERDTVGRAGHGVEEFLRILRSGIDARQAEERKGRIVGMDRQPDAHLFGGLGDLAHEEEEMFAQAFRRDVAVLVELVQEALAVIDCLARRNPVDQVAFDLCGAALRPGGQALLRRGDPFRRDDRPRHLGA